MVVGTEDQELPTLQPQCQAVSAYPLIEWACWLYEEAFIIPILQMGKLRLTEVASTELCNSDAPLGLLCSKFKALPQCVSILAAHQNHLGTLKNTDTPHPPTPTPRFDHWSAMALGYQYF